MRRSVDDCSVSVTRVKKRNQKLLRATLDWFERGSSNEGIGSATTKLEAAGVEALVNALRRFDPEQGNRFSTYANYWIMKLSIRRCSNRPV